MISNSFDTPVLLITFNRPEHVRCVLKEIRKQKPSRLFISQDGPREGNETDCIKIQEVRDIISELVDWPCDLKTLFQSKNLGCGPGPYAAISWFFENVDRGIILEDDIIPHPLFFSYMEQLLDKYSNDERIGAVMGHNLFRKYSLRNSYYFTFDTEGTLGWGTWKRVWEKVIFDIEVNKTDFDKALKKYFHFPRKYRDKEIQHFETVLNCDRHDRWDYQLEYCLKLNGYLNIKPNSCLTSHEGDDPDATHSGYSNPNYKMEVYEKRFAPIRHPFYVHIDILEELRMWKRTLKLFLS